MRKYGKLWIQISLTVKNKLIQFFFAAKSLKHIIQQKRKETKTQTHNTITIITRWIQ